MAALVQEVRTKLLLKPNHLGNYANPTEVQDKNLMSNLKHHGVLSMGTAVSQV